MGWQFWIDRGGTFTDIVAMSPAGELSTAKWLSVDPDRYDDAAVHGMRAILGLKPGEAFPSERVDAIKVGTTVATNALLERKGERIALITTAGLGDVLRIGTQHRPRLFDLNIVLPEMLYARVVEIPERVSATGAVLTALDEKRAHDLLHALYTDGIRALAIVFMHADRFPDHEKQVEALARKIGFTQISVSHRVNPVMKIVGRGDTTVADAYLSPVLRRYVDALTDKTNNARLYFMQSSGGLAGAARFQGKDAVLSGPAGGVVGAGETARAAGFNHIVGFDMGGTSTDVSHIAGEIERAYDTTVAGVRLRVPMMKIHTVAAGGGSICSFDGLRLKVGPESAGSHPGPASYRKGGPLTVTDCNVLLGKIVPEFFPRVFGPKGDQPLDADVVRVKFAALAAEISAATGKPRTPESLAEDFIAIAVDNMARAIKRVSVEQGHDISDHALACFGGAGGQHACLIAETLDLSTVIIHPLAGVLSALGIGLARQSVTKQQTVERALTAENLPAISSVLEALENAARDELARDMGDGQVSTTKRIHLRAEGSDTALAVTWTGLDDMRAAFTAAYRQKFGFAPDKPTVICERAEAETIEAKASTLPTATFAPTGTAKPTAAATVQGRPIYRRDELPVESKITGPALIAEANATTVVEPGWEARVIADGHLVLTRAKTGANRRTVTTARDPALIEIFNNLFMSIAEHMGAVLQSTARSVNIKERLDFSCAVFDGGGHLIANAPHMPVHLGSMGDSVRAVREKHGTTMRAGDSYVLNAPYNGGTHLPDITVVTPVMREGQAAPLFYVACRGHHADVGGITPGSMPPGSTTIGQEGVLLDNIPLVRAGVFLDAELRALLESGAYPARNVDQNVADLKAQAASTTIGAQQLLATCDRYGLEVVQAYMGHVQDYAEAAVRRAIGRLTSGARTCPMDDGSVIAVNVAIDRDRHEATVDFTGTSAQRPTNFNAPRSICRAAVLYVFRTLIDEDIPLNDGCMRPIKLIIPPGSMLDPRPPAAVVAGNVETSQIVCDALYGALGVLAASQGTMNNFTFGDARHQYYETIAGGSGAGNGFNGTSAVQTHMTNSRLTDPEVLEWRFPVVLERFAIRKGSGGAGAFRGGDGVERTLRFLAPMTASILSGRRATRPFGLNGGADALPGATTVHRADGTQESLSATASAELKAGDAITIATPGGGGFGKPA
ncbi:MAG: hydantoinase B/oxoprolinase family protein [Rhodospirillaceae bacterium]|nr:hydantoinase B/oxoprolinase family protein [Rhodospirillaceae bacterium]